MSRPAPDHPHVVYVAGAMRSGTTLIGQVVASSPDALLVGEVRSVIIDPHLHEHCDCGHPRPDCPYWSVPDAIQPSAAVARTATSMKAIPVLLASLVAGRPLTPAVGEVVDYLRAALDHAGELTLVDTSKTPTLVLLWRLAGARVHLVAAIRRPLDVARAQARPTEQTGVPQRPVPLSLAVWAAYQFGTLVTLPFTATRTVVPFRRFLANPVTAARRIWSAADLRPGTPDAFGAFSFDPSHVLAGNPRRARGSVVVRSAAG